MSDSVLTHPQFMLLQHIARQRRSASELASAVDASLPYVLSQLKLLEAQSFVKKQAIKEHKPGKPKQYYEISKPIANVLFVTKGYADKFSLAAHQQVQRYLQLVAQIPKEHHHQFSNYYWTHATYLDNVSTFALLESSKDRIELLAITTPEYLDELRKYASSYIIRHDGKKFSFACWMHSMQELEEGGKKKDNYYLKILKQAKPLLDPSGVVGSLQEQFL